MTVPDELTIARRVVAEACALVRGAAPGRVSTKSTPKDLVTEWDGRVEELIRRRLEELTPGVAIVGEETGGEAVGDRWVIDPIDGTVNFAHGLPLWTVTIALERDGMARVGVVHAPELGWEMWAARGAGAFLSTTSGGPPGPSSRDLHHGIGGEGERLRVSAVATLGEAILASGFPYDRATSRYNFAEWDEMQCRAGACRRLGAASLDLALVARGMLDGYWEGRLHPWDVSAGALLVEEAGGRVTDLTGGRFHSDDGGAVATNGAIHEDVLAVLREVRDRGGRAPG